MSRTEQGTGRHSSCFTMLLTMLEKKKIHPASAGVPAAVAIAALRYLPINIYLPLSNSLHTISAVFNMTDASKTTCIVTTVISFYVSFTYKLTYISAIMNDHGQVKNVLKSLLHHYTV